MKSSRVFWIVVAIAIAAGVFFRAQHVEHRKVKADETVTALRVSGHTEAEIRSLFNGRTYSVAEILRFQRVDPSEPLSATVVGLAQEEPQITPLFYVLDRWWAQLAGSSIPSLRIPAVLFGIAGIIAIYWFCLELTENAIVAGAAAGLMAVSPFFVTYGGQARQYSLWIALISAASAFLLRAVREPRVSTWVWYGIAIVLGLYTDVLTVFVVAAHAAYILLWYRRDRAQVVAFSIAAGCALVAFLPWIAIVASGHHALARDLEWTNASLSLREYARSWYLNIASVLFDAAWNNNRLAIVAIPVAVFLAYAAYRTQRDETRQTASLLAALALAITIPVLILDAATHGRASTVSRYLIPLWLALLVSVAIFFGQRIVTNGRLNVSWFAWFCIVLVIATVSSAINSSASAWWDNHDLPSEFVARTILSADAPLVLEDWNPNPIVLEMSHYLPPETTFLLFEHPRFPLPANRSAFLLVPSKTTIDAFRNQPGYELQRVPFPPGWTDYGLYRVTYMSRR